MNPKLLKAQKRIYRRRRLWLDALKASAYQDCGGSFPPECMDFDHRDPALKSFGIGNGLSSHGDALVLAEIAKCDLICANCHRIRTHKKVLDIAV